MNIQELLDDPNIRTIVAEITPYLPALTRMAKEHLNLFINHVIKEEWPEADLMIVRSMTPAERDDLGVEAGALAFAAALQAFNDEKTAKEILLRLLIVAATIAVASL